MYEHNRYIDMEQCYIVTCREILKKDMKNYFNEKRCHRGILDFLSALTREFVTNNPSFQQQTSTFLNNFTTNLRDHYNDKFFDIDEIQKGYCPLCIDCVSQTDLMEILSGFLNYTTDPWKNIRIKSLVANEIRLTEENDLLKLKILELEKEVRQFC